MPKDEEKVEQEQEQDPFDELVLDAPIKPKGERKWSTTGKAFEYAMTLSGKWHRMWKDFSTEMTDKGALKYKSVWAYIKELTKDEFKRDVLWEMIGPEPELEAGRRLLRVPWLGDWDQIRRQSFVPDTRKFAAIKETYKQRAQQLDAARAVAPLTIRQIARWENLAAQIDEAFAGQPFDLSEAPDSEKNVKRLSLYIKLQKKVLDTETQLWDSWYKAHGLNPGLPEHWLNMRIMDGMPLQDPAQLGDGKTIEGQTAAPQEIGGHAIKNVALPEGVSIDDLLLAKALRAKAKMYNMQLPGDLNAHVDDTSKDDVEKVRKGKVN